MKEYLAIDIGGSYLKYGRISHSGDIITHNKVETPNNWEEMLAVIHRIITKNQSQLRGIGISCPGRIDTTTGEISFGGSLPFLHGRSFKKIVEEAYGLPYAVINDGKAAALAEMWLGELKDVSYGAAIVLGTGVGGGLVVDGKLLEGAHFQAGELSFLLRSPDQIEQNQMTGWSASAVRFVRAGSRILGMDKPDGHLIFAVLEQGENQELLHLFKEFCREIAVVIINLQGTVDISKAVIGGGISTQPLLLKEIKQQYLAVRQALPMLAETFTAVDIAICRFGSEANLLGAVFQLLMQMDEFA